MSSTKNWGSWCQPTHPGVSMTLATTLVFVSFVLEIFHVKEKLKKDADPTDLVASANFAFVVWTFILMFFTVDWRPTFKLHALISFVLTLTFGILSAIENAAIRKDPAINNSLYALSLAACIIAWCALPCLAHVLYCCFWNTFVKRYEKNDVTYFISLASLFLTSLGFALWLNSGPSTVPMSPIMSNWIHGLFIAGSMFAAVATISYLFGIINDGDLLDLYSGIASVALLIFAIGALAVLDDNLENPRFLSAIALTYFNIVLLAYLSHSVWRKIWSQSWADRVLILLVVLAVIQFSLAMTKNFGVTTAMQQTPVINRDNWWMGILSAGFSSLIAAAFFGTLKKHLPTSVNFHFAALVLYCVYWVAECVQFDKNKNVTATFDFIHRKTVAALVLAAVIILLLLIALIMRLGCKTRCATRCATRSCCYTVVEDVPERLCEYDITVLVEGSDSFNNSVATNGGVEEAFTAIQKLIKTDFICGLEQRLGSRATFSFIQYSGIKQLAKHYKAPGSGWADKKAGLKHYQVEIEKTSLAGAKRSSYAENLDGNAQLFLLLQDMNLKCVQNGRRQILLIICDEEWDVDGLKTPAGASADEATIARTTAKNFETYPIVIRPNELKNPNEQFFKNNLASKSGNYKKIFNRNFDPELKRAFREILADLK